MDIGADAEAAHAAGPAWPPDLAAVVERLGPPVRWRFHLPMQPHEFEALEQSGAHRRAQEATVLIRSDALPDPPIYDTLGAEGVPARPGSFVAVAKTWYPDGVYRYPAGGVLPGESVVSSALREAALATGLEVRLTRYVLATDGAFYLGDPHAPERVQPWRSHVFLAEPLDAAVAPRDAMWRDARVVGAEEMLHRIHPRLLATGRGGFAYRVGMQERALGALGVNHLPWRIEAGGDGPAP